MAEKTPALRLWETASGGFGFPLLVAGLFLTCGCVHAQILEAPQVAFSRIIRGWTNYSTAFNATHDTAATADFATVATFYTPTGDVMPLDYAVTVVSSETRPPDFARFQFQISVWSDLAQLILDPKRGDVAHWVFAAPTGGNTSVPDTFTRGGRPAYELRFALSNSPVILSNGHGYWIGFAARGDTQRDGELFVPTSSHAGPSDVQAGDLVVGGWQYLVNAGGSTVYSGQLAVELVVAPIIDRPRLQVAREGGFVRLSWTASATGFGLESSFGPGTEWLPVEVEPFEENGFKHVRVPATLSRQWFRLHR